MLVYITGVPGSGKTYKAVYHIFLHFGKASKQRDEKYLHCYTNIDAFNFDAVDDRVKRLDFDQLKSYLSVLHQMYKKKVSDAELIEKAKEFDIYKALFVIDEAHNYFQSRDPVLIWWLTYHRHLYQDIFLITQNLALIESKYKPLAEYFYKAVPSSLRFNKKVFRYNVFVDHRMCKDAKVKVEKLKLDPEVLQLYHSADDTRAPNFLRRFILLFFVFLFVASLVFYFLVSNLTSGSQKKTQSSSANIKQISPSDAPKSSKQLSFTLDEFSDSEIITILCFSGKCFYKDRSFPFSSLRLLLHSTGSKSLLAQRIDGTNVLEVTIIASSDFLNLFRSSNHEKDSTFPLNPFRS